MSPNSKVKIGKFLSPELVLIDNACTARDEVLKAMVGTLSTRGLLAHPEKLLQDLLEREKSSFVTIGPSTAMPHARCQGLPAPLIVVLLSKTGLLYRENCPEMVHLVVLILTPQEKPTLHLKMLAAAASLLRKTEELFPTLLQADDAVSIMKIMGRIEEGDNG